MRLSGKMAGVLIEQIAGWGQATFKPAVQAESDGIEGAYGLGLIWSLDRITRDNTAFRTDEQLRAPYMPFDGLVFFARRGQR